LQILVKTMLKKHSFSNPFKYVPPHWKDKFQRDGRSHSAPSAYELFLERRLSLDVTLPVVSELAISDKEHDMSGTVTQDPQAQDKANGAR